MIRARIAVFAPATAAAARAIMACTNPGEGSAPVSASTSSAQRCTGMACAAIRYTHQDSAWSVGVFPGLQALLDRQSGDHQAGRRIGPPPPEPGVQADAEKGGRRGERADRA